MKRLLIILTLLPLLTLSCFIFDGGNQWGRSLVQLLNNLPDGITKIHAAIYEGYPVGSSNVINTATLNPGDALSMEVPPGELRYFLILAENTDGVAEYMGLSGPYSVPESGTVNVVVAMNQFTFNASFSGRVNPGELSWDIVPGADYYAVFIDDCTDPVDLLSITPTIVYYTARTNRMKVRAYFSTFDLYSVFSNDAGSGC